MDQYSSVSSWKRWWGPFWLTNILRGLYRPPKWPKNTHKPPQNSYFEAKPERWCSQILLSVLQWPSIVVFSGKNDGGVHFSKKKIFLGTIHRRKIPPKNSSKCLLWLIVCHSSNTIFGDWTDPIITVIIIPCCWPTHLTCSKSVCFNCLLIASENDPNEFPMPPNLRIDTKIRLVGCSEPKLQVWPCYGNLSDHEWPFWPLRSFWGVWKWSQRISHATIHGNRHQNHVSIMLRTKFISLAILW